MSAATIEPGGTPRNDGPAPLVARIDRSWGSGPGTHGGHLAALGLAAMRARLVGEFGEDRPVRALATHFLARVGDRPLALHAVVERVGRDAAVCPGRSPAFTRSTASAGTSERCSART
jgi:acyl-coenzyme A thioesterase PaaI-like protein